MFRHKYPRRFHPRPIRRPWRPFLFVLYIIILTVVSAKPSGHPMKPNCPKECDCFTTLDNTSPNFGRTRRISCSKGGMTSIPIDDIDKTIRIIFITAPATNPNNITVGPYFTHPEPMDDLEEVHIIHSSVPSIGQYSFWGLQQLKLINLSFNCIRNISFDNFRGLVFLKILHLDNNLIESMPSEVFRHLTSLKVLTLSNNRITTLMPRVFRMLADLQYLDLSYNLLENLNPEVFKDIQILKVFKCRRCELHVINPQIYYILTYLEELDLGENQIKFLTFGEFVNLKRLQVLHLDGNQLSVIVDDIFSSNTMLRYLSVADNRLALLAPAALSNLFSLQHLDISFNKISKFHLQTFSHIIHSLISINFSGNNLDLDEIAALLQILPNLQHVGLGSLSLQIIPQNYFSGNVHVVSLDLSGNKFITLPFKLLKKIYPLHGFNISNNQLTTLDEKDLLRLEGIAELDLTNNPWRCNCDAAKMITYMMDSVLNNSIRELECQSPFDFKGRKFGDLTVEKLDPCTTPYQLHINIITGLLVLILVMVICVSIYFCCLKRPEVRYIVPLNHQDEGEATDAQGDSEQSDSNSISVAIIDVPYHLEEPSA